MLPYCPGHWLSLWVGSFAKISPLLLTASWNPKHLIQRTERDSKLAEPMPRAHTSAAREAGKQIFEQWEVTLHETTMVTGFPTNGKVRQDETVLNGRRDKKPKTDKSLQ